MESTTNGQQLVKSKPRFFYGFLIVGVAFIIHLIAFGISDSFGALVNPLADEFGWSRAAISGANSVMFILSGALAIVMGIVTDKYGPRLALSICAVCLGAGFLLMSQLHDLWQLYLFFGIIFGIGMSGIWAPILSVISRWFVGKRGLITGIVISGGGLGAFIGPPVITGLLDKYGWVQATLFLGIFVFVVVFVAAQFLKRDPTQVGQTPYGEKIISEPESKSISRDFSLVEAMRTIQFWILFGMYFCLAFYTFSIFVHVMPHAIQLGIPTASAAFILASISGMGIIGNYVMGRVCDKIGPRKIFIISFFIMSAALFWLVYAHEIWSLYLFSFAFGFNHGGNATAQTPIIARVFGLKAVGTIFGVAFFGFTIGGAVGPLVTGYIFDVTGGYQLAFVVCGAIGVIGLALASILRPTKRMMVRI